MDDDAAHAALVEADSKLAAMGVAWRTLQPGGARMPPLASIELGPLQGSARLAAARGVADLSIAMARAFPENIFADFAYPVAAIAQAAGRSDAPEAHVLACFAALIRLHELYGGDTPIRFRYVHDFLYGFDWTRWVARSRAARAGVGPFDLPFLAYSEQRAKELMALIANDDAKYHRLREGESRNPFPFRRDPVSEAALMWALAADGAIPVEAWRADAMPASERDYRAERERRAKAMGLFPDAARTAGL